MNSFHEFFNFFWNPFTELALMAIFFACVFLWLQRSEMNRVFIVIPVLPWLAALAIVLNGWSSAHWTTHAPINSYGLEYVTTLFLGNALSPITLHEPGGTEFLLYFMLLALVANAVFFLYCALVRWPVQKAKEELEAAVGRDTGRRIGRRSSTFVGETGMEPSAPVSALLNRPPGSRLGQAMEGNPLATGTRTQSDADRVAAMQRDVAQGVGVPTSAAAVASPAGAGSNPTADSARLAQLISSIQSTPAAPAAGHCTKCGVVITQPDHHQCPVPGGDNLFCGKCGAPHEPKAKVCAACETPLNQN